jgi:hypothetical protein
MMMIIGVADTADPSSPDSRLRCPSLLAERNVSFGQDPDLRHDSLGKLRADLRRINAIAGSPLISLYHDAIEGTVMIRA